VQTSGAEAHFFVGLVGTAEAVPFPKPFLSTRLKPRLSQETFSSERVNPRPLRHSFRRSVLKTSILIGVISDTHSLLRSEAVAALRGSEHIIHAGDVGDPEILNELAKIAPLTAIRGNIDKGKWARKLPETEVVEVGGIQIYVLHDLSQLDLKPEAAGFQAVIYGHSHVPKNEIRGGVLYFNPGSAGPKRFKLPISVGKLSIADGKINSELITITD